MRTDPQAVTRPVAPDLLLVVFIHGFKGNDETFAQFPEHLQRILTASLPHVIVESVVFPQYETKGILREAVDRFAEWLVNLIIEREIAHGTSDGAGRSKVVLCGHSMGGLLAADTLIQLADDRPDAAALLWPRVIALVAFDTPYLGLHPSVLQDHAAWAGEFLQTGYNLWQYITSQAGSTVPALTAGEQTQVQVGTAATAVAAVVGLPASLWQRLATRAPASAPPPEPEPPLLQGVAKPASAPAPAPSLWQRLTASASAPAPEPSLWQRLTASAPKPEPSLWQRLTASAPKPEPSFWQRLIASTPAPEPSLLQNLAVPAAYVVGGALIAGALGAVYARRADIADAYGWAHAHLRYVSHLWDEDELRARLRRVGALERELGVRFRAYYTRAAPRSPQPRTFCAVPPAHEPGAAHWVPAPNALVDSEILAHVGMFESRTNDGYDQLSQNTAALIREAITMGRG